jgi:hypothetical protein
MAIYGDRIWLIPQQRVMNTECIGKRAASSDHCKDSIILVDIVLYKQGSYQRLLIRMQAISTDHDGLEVDQCNDPGGRLMRWQWSDRHSKPWLETLILQTG